MAEVQLRVQRALGLQSGCVDLDQIHPQSLPAGRDLSSLPMSRELWLELGHFQITYSHWIAALISVKCADVLLRPDAPRYAVPVKPRCFQLLFLRAETELPISSQLLHSRPIG